MPIDASQSDSETLQLFDDNIERIESLISGVERIFSAEDRGCVMLMTPDSAEALNRDAAHGEGWGDEQPDGLIISAMIFSAVRTFLREGVQESAEWLSVDVERFPVLVATKSHVWLTSVEISRG